MLLGSTIKNNRSIKSDYDIILVGDAFSGYQGWIIGAMNTASIAFDNLKNNLN